MWNLERINSLFCILWKLYVFTILTRCWEVPEGPTYSIFPFDFALIEILECKEFENSESSFFSSRTIISFFIKVIIIQNYIPAMREVLEWLIRYYQFLHLVANVSYSIKYFLFCNNVYLLLPILKVDLSLIIGLRCTMFRPSRRLPSRVIVPDIQMDRRTLLERH